MTNTESIAALCLSFLVAVGGATAQDLNGNSIRDSYDIRVGTSLDCNHNGTPDEADLAKPDFAAAIEHHSDSATLTNVTGLTTVDFDLDGDLDIIAASRAQASDSSLTLWRNDGGPALVYATRITVTNALCHLVRAADLNADGRMDIVASDAGFAQVIVVLATGPGTFAAPIRLTSGSRATGIAVGDLDADGDSDIALPGFANNLVEVFLNNGNATFAARRTFACGQQPVAVAIADFTGDGLADLAVANSFISAAGTGTVTLLRATGGGMFVLHSTISVLGHAETSSNSAPHDIWLKDINADGDADLLVSSKDSNSLRIYTNNGVGGFSNTQTLGPLDAVGATADRFVCTNLDNDPALELAWCDSGARAVRVYDNVAGLFEFSQSYAAGSEGPIDVTAGDLTGDGLVELAAAGNSSSAFSTMDNQGALNFESVIHMRRLEASYYPILADFTGDGVTDLASYFTSDNPASFRIARGLGSNRFAPEVQVPLPTAGHILARDADNDGDLDILSLGNSGNRFTMLNNADGSFAAPIFSSVIVLSGNWQTADINNDGHLDMLWTRTIISNQPSFVAISLGDGHGHFAPPTEFITPPFFGAIWTGDLSGDGAPEIFAGVGDGLGVPGMETLLVYPNNGDGTFGDYQVHSYDLVPNFASSVGGFAWVDIDSDGDDDLLGQSTYTWLYRNDNHQLSPPVNIGGFANYGIGQFGPKIQDIDGDGDLDFFGSASISSVVSPAAFFNDGAGSFGPVNGIGPRLAVMRYRASTDTIVVGDADNNGRPDMLVKPQGFGDWYLHLNVAPSVHDCNANGVPDSCDITAGTSTDTNANGVPDECDALCRADFNADGSSDFFDYDDFVRCFEGLACPPGTSADFDADGTIDFFDYDAFVTAFELGC
ncbi:MAG: VCBS repeat-containing protein [Planctomycetota bacterium]